MSSEDLQSIGYALPRTLFIGYYFNPLTLGRGSVGVYCTWGCGGVGDVGDVGGRGGGGVGGRGGTWGTWGGGVEVWGGGVGVFRIGYEMVFLHG